MPFTQSQIEELHQFRRGVAEDGGVYEPRFSDDESIVFVSLREIAAEVVLHRLSPADGKIRLAEIARVFAGMDPALDRLIGRVEDSIAFVEAENRDLVA